MDNTKEGHQRFAQSQLEQGLKSAIQNRKIRLESEGAWVELDLQSNWNDKIKAYANGGRDGTVEVNGWPYKQFTGLWNATGLDPSHIDLDEADRGNWAGVRIEKKGMPITSITSTANQPMWKMMRLQLPIGILRRCRSFSATARLLRHGSRKPLTSMRKELRI